MDVTIKERILSILESLISFRSITPKDEGAILFCENFLNNLHFKCINLDFSGVKNLYAKIGTSDNTLCFAGHVDVVPPFSGWTVNPFQMNIKDDSVFGRGANDMKGPLAACLAAVSDVIRNNLLPPNISVSFMLTSDEEIMGENGTSKVVDFLKKRNEKIAGCILCESCSNGESGEYIKVGCRGSLNVDIGFNGQQCHVATAIKQGNHLHEFIEAMNYLCKSVLDDGTDKFPGSSIQMTSIQTPIGCVRNVVSSEINALLNVRFNDLWTFDTLEDYITRKVFPFGVSFQRFKEPFIGASAKFVEFLTEVISSTVGRVPEVGADGGNSDAVFIKTITEVAEIGSPIANAHLADEFIKIDDLIKLNAIYRNSILYFAR
jgi:succinyl-diaminopimelate desuccinylase